MSTFTLIWLGQLISLVGTGLTRFTLGVWVFQETGSVTRFALIALFATLPTGLFLPVSGALVDRWNRRWVMMISDSIAALATLGLLFFYLTGHLVTWHIYVAVAIQAAASAFQWPAYAASIPILVPKEHLGRASGMVQSAHALTEIAAPALGGALLGAVGLQGVIALDLLSFLFAVTMLLLVRIPQPARTTAGAAGQGTLRHESLYGWRYILARPGLLALLTYFATINFVYAMSQVLITPLVLSFTTEQVLGLVLATGGAGAVLGSALMAVWGGPRRRVYGVLLFGSLMSLSLFIMGARPVAFLVAVGSFISLLGVPIISGCNQAIWMQRVEPDLQGRMAAIRAFLGASTLPTAYLLAGPLADRIFEPLLRANGPLAGSVGQVIGVGPGRGIAFLLMILGLIPLLASFIAYRYPRLRFVEDDLPDTLNIKEHAPEGA
ncbi:MAG: MFS transporter [Ardenticatenales bacterium]|nr:MFS transporter [Ardenticatenales bacterium]